MRGERRELKQIFSAHTIGKGRGEEGRGLGRELERNGEGGRGEGERGERQPKPRNLEFLYLSLACRMQGLFHYTCCSSLPRCPAMSCGSRALYPRRSPVTRASTESIFVSRIKRPIKSCVRRTRLPGILSARLPRPVFVRLSVHLLCPFVSLS